MMLKQDAIPLTDKEFDLLMEELGPYESQPHIAVAVSGGSDSLALAYMLKNWVALRGGKLTALIVDHELRHESTQEAHQVKVWLDRLGIRSIILSWCGEKPAQKIQEIARSERYKILTQWCQQNQVWHLCIGHHQDDQWETIMQRLSHGTGLIGLQGISAKRWVDGVRLLRPFLSKPKLAMQAILSAIGQDYIKDPSNENLKFERSHWRQLKDRMNALGLTNDNLLKTASESKAWYQVLENQWLSYIEKYLHVSNLAKISFNAQAFWQLPEPIQDLGLTRLIRSLSAPNYDPGRKQLQDLKARLRSGKSVTCGNCYWWHQQHLISVVREVRSIIKEQPISSQKFIWDNRFQITLSNFEPNMVVAPLGDIVAQSMARKLKCHSRVLAVLPGIFLQGKLISIPHFDGESDKFHINLHFRHALADHKL